MAKIVYALSDIYYDDDPLRAKVKMLARLANLGEFCRLREGNFAVTGSDTTPFRLPEAMEIEDTLKDVPSYGFKSRKARFCCAGCRRMEKLRGHRCGKK